MKHMSGVGKRVLCAPYVATRHRHVPSSVDCKRRDLNRAKEPVASVSASEHMCLVQQVCMRCMQCMRDRDRGETGKSGSKSRREGWRKGNHSGTRNPALDDLEQRNADFHSHLSQK